MSREPCTDPRMPLGGGLAGLVSALATCVLPTWWAVSVQLVAAVTLLALAGWAMRSHPAAIPPHVHRHRSGAIDDALRALGGDNAAE